MDNRLEKWAQLLLDTGKRNNLINFKDTKSGTAEIVAPDGAALFKLITNGATVDVFDAETDLTEGKISREEYISGYAEKLRSRQILLYSGSTDPVKVIKNIGKRAKTAIEETGVNTAYIAAGFINWFEENEPGSIMKAPVLLAPITITSESAVSAYRIKIDDDEIILNPTFSYKLAGDYGIKLPEYSGGDIKEYLSETEKILEPLKWTVTEESKIGLFSYQKINMYSDLKENADKILKNKNILTLLNGGGDDGGIAEEGGIEDLLDLHNVVDADSSQAEAVDLASRGKSFVLQGPPGTGKSQTITNIIAECLYNGKKVLFVSEKLAALNVVYDKLKRAGLEDFCLELHSHKANKKSVTEELNRTLRLPKSKLSSGAEGEIAARKKHQKLLDAYAAELHTVRPVINKSLYSVYQRAAKYRDACVVDYVIDDIGGKGEDYLAEAGNALDQFAKYSQATGYDYHGNIWYGYTDPDVSYQSVFRLKSQLAAVISFTGLLEKLQNDINTRYAVDCRTPGDVKKAVGVLSVLADSSAATNALLDKNTLDGVIAALNNLKKIEKKLSDVEDWLDSMFDAGIYGIDGKSCYKTLISCGGLSRLFNKGYKAVISQISAHNTSGKKLKHSDAVKAADFVQSYNNLNKFFDETAKAADGKLGSAYKGHTSDWDDIIAQLTRLKDAITDCTDLKKVLKDFSPENYQEERRIFAEISEEYNKAKATYGDAFTELSARFDKSIFDISSADIAKLRQRLTAMLNDIEGLGGWCTFNALLRKMDKLGIMPFADLCLSKKISLEEISSAYRRIFYNQWADYIVCTSSVLTSLTRIPHDSSVAIFSEKDNLQFKINKEEIKNKLSAARPDTRYVAAGSQMAILMREGEKKRRLKGIRALLGEIPDLALTLKPCFLMSPLSVSTYLSPDLQFDLVIFDEASQVFPQDAVGAIYRGKQLIVVGDSQQMPPGNFFTAVVGDDEDEDYDDDITDFESILDLCSVSFPQLRLKWHYRSRYEQLIAFSNHHFYDNSLITFPSAKAENMWTGVDYYYVNGKFDRKSKTNREEAEFIVDLIYKNIEMFPERSLGVVAFSISQQELIESLLAKRRKSDALHEEFFRSESPEPFFIKNLETVQGDERDTIIFSVAYGYDIQGRILYNFGPLNREGGERRLNVAVTRAKHNVQVVASMHAGDIDLKRVSSKGARLLRAYLDYAENGEIALQREIEVKPSDSYDSDFEAEVCAFLRENGFAVDTQVGCSGFRIDLGVKRQDSSDYVLAVECDGASYHSSRTARDRDRLRQSILENMGWKFYRIWSTDWFRNKKDEKQRLLNAVSNAIAVSEDAKE